MPKTDAKSQLGNHLLLPKPVGGAQAVLLGTLRVTPDSGSLPWKTLRMNLNRQKTVKHRCE